MDQASDKMRAALLSAVCMVLSCLSFRVLAGERAPKWEVFVSTPTFDAYRDLGQLRKEPCSSSRPTDLEFRELLHQTAAGNGASFQALLDIRSCLDGGALEDFFRASGLYLERQPFGFVALVQQEKIKESDLGYMLAMLPLDTVDQPKLRLKVLEARIATVSQVRLPELSRTVSRCKKILVEEANDYRQILDGSSK
jgi:hypothetical protein